MQLTPKLKFLIDLACSSVHLLGLSLWPLGAPKLQFTHRNVESMFQTHPSKNICMCVCVQSSCFQHEEQTICNKDLLPLAVAVDRLAVAVSDGELLLDEEKEGHPLQARVEPAPTPFTI